MEEEIKNVEEVAFDGGTNDGKEDGQSECAELKCQTGEKKVKIDGVCTCVADA